MSGSRMKLAAEQRITESHRVVRRHELQRRQWQATVWMVLCMFAMTGLTIFQHHHPANIIFGTFAAFAEAAVIGGFAIWFAVMVPLKMLLDPPIPHADTVCRNQSWFAAKPRRIMETVFFVQQQKPYSVPVQFNCGYWKATECRHRQCRVDKWKSRVPLSCRLNNWSAYLERRPA